MMNNDRLLIRALEKGRGGEPAADFASRVMERIERQRKMEERRENRILLIGAICCGVGIILFAVLLIQLYAGTEFSVLGQAFSWMWASVSAVFRGRGASSAFDSGTQLWLWTYMALLFLAFSVTSELLRKRL